MKHYKFKVVYPDGRTQRQGTDAASYGEALNSIFMGLPEKSLIEVSITLVDIW
jgi:hypothetical protein